MWVSGRHQSRLQTPEALSARYLRLGNTLPQRKCTLHNATPSPPQSSPWPSGSRSWRHIEEKTRAHLDEKTGWARPYGVWLACQGCVLQLAAKRAARDDGLLQQHRDIAVTPIWEVRKAGLCMAATGVTL